MTVTDKQPNYFQIIKKYLSEVLIIFLGISISFLFDEWRDGRKDDETAYKHLTVLKTNLVQDTTILSVHIEMLKRLVHSTDKLIYFESASEVSDSIDYHIDKASSYAYFKPNQMAYEEIKQTGHTNLIKNDTLKKAFLLYYTAVIPLCTEWCTVDETQTMTQLIPEMTNYFPVVSDKQHLISIQEKATALKTKKLRNMLLASSTYKQTTVQVLMHTKKSAKDLLKILDEDLKKR
jgi:hypothetical protein